MYDKTSVTTAGTQHLAQAFFRVSVAIPAFLILAACAALPLAPEEENLAAKRFTPDPENGSIYIFHQTKFIFGPNLLTTIVLIDGRLVSSEMKAGTFLYVKAPPGQHDLSSKKGGSNPMGASVTTLTVEKGKLYFIEMTYDRGWSTLIPVLTVISEEAGKKKVLERDLVKTDMRPGQLAPKIF